jgi:hypothetical protein
MKRLLLLVAVCLNVQADDLPATLTTTDGKTYQRISSIKPDGDAVRIVHQDGAATIPYQNIPEAQLAAFGYDPSVPVKDRAAKSAANAAAYDKQLAALAAAERKKADGIVKLKQSYYGGSYYQESQKPYRDEIDRQALATLKSHGFTEPEALSAMAKLRAEQKANRKPVKKLPPQGQLRNGPSIDFKKNKSIKK